MASEGNEWSINHANSKELRYVTATRYTSVISLFVTGGRLPAHSALYQGYEWPQWADPALGD